VISAGLTKNNLVIVQKDKKVSIISLTVKTENELFSKLFETYNENKDINEILEKEKYENEAITGKKAVDFVGKVLGDNPDISVLIEGHTDNDKIVGSIGGGVENNWDLSTKRATAIVTILSANAKVKKENLTAAGRGEFAPLLSNETAEGKAKNRRIEFILTPKLDELSKLLNEL
jgi:flagellar motor protein MotB